jgi:mRNA interferase HigB
MLVPGAGTWHPSEVRVFNNSTIVACCKKYPNADQALRLWQKIARKATWKNSAELKRDYPSASVVTRTRVVFNIRHNEYRLVVSIRYDKQRLYVRFFGTHKEYDKIDAATI